MVEFYNTDGIISLEEKIGLSRCLMHYQLECPNEKLSENAFDFDEYTGTYMLSLENGISMAFNIKMASKPVYLLQHNYEMFEFNSYKEAFKFLKAGVS